MNASALLDDLRRRGIVLTPAGDRLRYRPKDAVDDELRRVLAEHKPDLLQLLEAEAAEVAWRIDVMRDQVPQRGRILFLTARPGVASAPGICWSCGDPLPADEPDPCGLHVRCRFCREAARRAILEVRAGVLA